MLLYVMVIQEQHHNKQVNIYKQLKHIGVINAKLKMHKIAHSKCTKKIR